MIKITNSLIRSNSFTKAGQKVFNCTEFSSGTLHNVGMIFKKLVAIEKSAIELFNKIQDKHIQKDEAGKPVINEGKPVFKDEAAYIKDMDEYLAIEHTINRHRITLDVLGPAKLSAQDMHALEPLLDLPVELEEVK